MMRYNKYKKLYCILALVICTAFVPLRAETIQELFIKGDYEGAGEKDVLSEDEAGLRMTALFFQGRYGTIETETERLLKLMPEAFAAAEIRASVALEKGDFETVRKLHEQGYGDISFLNMLYLTGDDSLVKSCTAILQKHAERKEQSLYSVLATVQALRFLDRHQRAMNELQAFKTDKPEEKMMIMCVTGELFLEKYNTRSAETEFRNALEVSKKYMPALEGITACAYAAGDLITCEHLCDKLLAVNPGHVEAYLYKARIRLLERDDADAEKMLEPVFRLNPKNPEGLAVRAALLKLQRKEKEFNEVLEMGKTSGYSLSQFYLPLADFFVQQKKGDWALDYLRPLLAVDSENASVLSSIAWLLLRKGQIEDAKEMFEQAHEADDFNYMVYNVLHLLDKLELYERKETEHFDIVFDPSVDAVSADYFSYHVEEMYDKLSKQYNYTVEGKIHLFLFPKHSYLAVMTTGLPNLGMPALCVGNSIYCDTPNVLKTHMSMNWYKVVRHEVVHVFNLLQTDFNVPHWFTEGLAVLSEEQDRRYDWDRTLLRALILDNLHPLDEMNLGFYRPEDSLSRFQAYAEAYFTMLFIIKQHGFDKINGFLQQFAKGQTFRQACEPVLGISQEELQKELDRYYREYLSRLTLSPRFIPEDVEKLQKLLQEGNIDAGAWFIVQTGSQDLIDRMKNIGGNSSGGLTDRLTVSQATFFFRKGNVDKALALLEKVEFDRGYEYFNLKGQCFKLKGEREKARAAFHSAWEKYRHAPETIYNIAVLEKELGNPEGYAKWMELYLKTADEEVSRYVEYALYLIEQKQPSKAVRILEKAKMANPSDPEMRVVLGKAYLMRRNFSQALKEYKSAALIKPDDEKIQADYQRVLKFVEKAKAENFK